jgi:hypothetical protein
MIDYLRLFLQFNNQLPDKLDKKFFNFRDLGHDLRPRHLDNWHADNGRIGYPAAYARAKTA